MIKTQRLATCLATKLLREGQDAADVVQDALVIVLGKHGEADPHFAPRLMVTVRNLCNRHNATPRLFALDALASEQICEARPPAECRRSPTKRRIRRLAEHAIDRLPREKDRQVARLLLMNFTHAQIAAELGMSRSTASPLIQRLYRKLGNLRFAA